MYPTRLLLVLICSGFGIGCGAAPMPTRGGDDLSDAVDSALAELPTPKSGTIHGDGFGPTSREAVIDARRAVSEQINAQVRSETRAEETETDGLQGRKTEVRTRSTTTFEHAELLKTRGLIERPGGFAARVVLDKAEAIAVYRKELEADDERLKRLQPVLETAITEGDASVLLHAEYAPSVVLGEMARRRRVIERLGGRSQSFDSEAQAQRLARRAAQARAKVIIRLSVDGGDNPHLSRAVVEAIGGLLDERGCRMTDESESISTAGPIAEALIVIRSRDHKEHGLLWRYLGVELRMVDSRTGKALFEFLRMPSFVHGGGPSWDQADRATARRFKERLAEESAAFASLVCR